MNYQEAREYLNIASKKGIVLGLSVMEELMKRLGNPEKELSVVHIAGTNGKGSILAYLESIFLAAGYKTGRYVSPALGEYENRFLINGVGIEKAKIPVLVEKIKNIVEKMEAETGLSPTQFEIETALAYLCFQEEQVQIAFIETGMGGRLDATNVIQKPILSIIASVSMDHMGMLGDTLEQIAMEKAGIIKEGCPVLLYPENSPKVKEVIRKVCEEKQAFLYEIEQLPTIIEETSDFNQFTYGKHESLMIRLPGHHQIYNGLVAVEAVKLLSTYCITEDHIRTGLANTRWSGRLEKISDNPLIYLDGAHNRDAAKRLAEFIRQHFIHTSRIDFGDDSDNQDEETKPNVSENRRILALTGVLADKEYDVMMETVLPLVSKAAVFTPDNPRALASEELLKVAQKYCSECTNVETVEAGMEWIQNEAGEDDVVIIFGSLSFMDQINKDSFAI